jgi:peptidyl-prolyl cis-trans isomerase SurA
MAGFGRRTSTAAIATAMAVGALGLSGFIVPAAAQSTIKVVVNGDPITSNEIAERARFLRLVHRNLSAGELTKAATDELVDDKLRAAEAKRVGMSVSDAEVEVAFGRMAAGMKTTPAVLSQGLQSQGVNPRTLKNRIKVQMVWQRLVMARFNRTVSIADAAIQDAFERKTGEGGDKNAVAQGTTTEYQLQQVTLVVPKQPPGLGAQRLKEAEALRAKITSCDQLVDAVRSVREAVVRPLGKRTADELPAQFRDVLNGVAVGRLSKPVPTPAAVEMLAVCGTREIQGDLTIRSKVETELREQEGQLLARRYLADLKRQAIIDYK